MTDRPTLSRSGAQAAQDRQIVARKRPDPGPMRLVFGLAGLATLSAMATSVVTAPPPTTATPVTQVSVVYPTARPVKHVTRYVHLAPGQTAPPQAATKQLPAPSPKVVVVRTTTATTTTRQSTKQP